MHILKIIIAFCLALSVAACGGGGTGTTATTTPTTKSYAILLQNAPAGGASFIRFDLLLPSGTSVNVDTTTNTVLSSSLTLTGVSNAILTAGIVNGAVRVGVISTSGIASGQFATLTVNLTGAAPVPSDFIIQNPQIQDMSGNDVNTASIALQAI